MTIEIVSVTSTDLFVGTEAEPRQVVKVVLARAAGAAPSTVEITGPRVRGEAPVPIGVDEVTVEVPVATDAAPGTCLPISVRVGGASAQGTLTVAETGWTMFLVSHFHYDPVWWNTQAAYTQTWELQGNDGTTRPVWEHNGFNLVRAHLDMARTDPDYAFVLAEVDYLKPFWDVHPEYRGVLRELIAAGRVEVMGGTYNEPNTNLTGSETTIRNLVYGIGYQRSIMGADPRTAWLLDVFGHDPQFPGLAAEAGLTSSSWARGPYHQWGPILTKFDEAGGDARHMQFPAEFEWLSPSGRGVVTHYMPNHYSAGWWMDSSASLEEAEHAVYELFQALKPVAATRNTLLPVGTDYTPPNKWVTAIHRSWASKYVWPRFVCGTPRDFFAAVSAEMASRGVAPSPQTRDMNPLYTGKDVSYIDTKQAQRAAEVAATDAEKLATFASLLGLGRYPEKALDKVWRQLAYGAHHDAITGSESDQVYIDLITGWREAYNLATDVRDRSLDALAAQINTHGNGLAVTVTNTLSFPRTDVVRVPHAILETAGSDRTRRFQDLRLVDDAGDVVPCVVDAGVLVFVARDVPGTGWRTWRLVPGSDTGTGWEPADGDAIGNEFFAVAADPARGGGLRSIVERATGRELLRDGAIGNELRLYDEYDQHPEFGEGPWHLVPTGSVASSASSVAQVRAEKSPAGERLIVTGTVGEVTYEQRITLWRGLDRVELRTRVREFTGSDKLLRVKFPVDVPGARPVSEVAGAVIARGFGFPDSDAARAPWTLDNPANTAFGLSSTAALRLRAPGGGVLGDAALAIAEVVVPSLEEAAPLARDLVVALARVGVTATTSTAAGSRYGWLRVDSNLPDVRIVLGGPDQNELAAELAERAGAVYRDALKRELDDRGAARLYVPAEQPLDQVWVAGADLRDVRALPALIVAGVSAEALAEEIAALAAEFGSTAAAATTVDVGSTALLDPYTVGIASYGLPGFVVDPSGALHLSLMRSCTGWPSGIWLDPPVRRTPDGTAFQLQHWTHDFDYALFSGAGDWRDADLVVHGHRFSTPLLVRVGEPHDGDLPPRHALLTVTPERQVQVQTVKPSGNPSATGAAAGADPANGVTVRLVETTGRPVTARVESAFGWTSAHHTDLLETSRRPAPVGAAAETALDGGVAGTVLDGEVVETGLDGAQIATVIGVPARSAAGGEVLGVTAELAQPVYSRYWLHNRGPAPLGFFPVSVTATPTVLTVDGPVETTVTVASHHTESEFTGVLRVAAPEGWTAEPAERPLALPAGGHTSFPLGVTPPAEVAPGLYFVRVQLPVAADRQWEDVVEDVVTVLVPGGPADEVLPPPAGDEIAHTEQIKGTGAGTARPLGLEITGADQRIEVAPGATTTFRLRLANHTAGRIDGEAMAVSPWGTWDFVGPYAQPFTVQPGGSGEVTCQIEVPADSEPGHWWLMVKLMWYGRVQYTPAVPLVVTAP
ncbi:MAG: glycoside hydrolase family 38 C-terminal domain-containing protein [Micromonosporaceae bacterium]